MTSTHHHERKPADKYLWLHVHFAGRVVVHDSTDTWKDKILSDLDVEAIKKNPSKFTAQNRIGPYFIGEINP